VGDKGGPEKGNLHLNKSKRNAEEQEFEKGIIRRVVKRDGPENTCRTKARADQTAKKGTAS